MSGDVWTYVLLAGLALEAVGIFDKVTGNTLSEWTRRFFRTDTSRVGRVVFTALWGSFAAWFLAHILRIEGTPMTTPARKQDARVRASRTVVQGAAAVVVVAVVTAVLDALSAGEWTWRTLGVSALTAALTALGSYVQRRLEPEG